MKTVLITGASRGIGEALAEKFLAEGYFVIGTSTSGESTFSHENIVFFQLDLSNTASITECVQRIADLKRPIDILINNAGIAIEAELDETQIVVEHVRKIFEVNVMGTIDFTERIIPLIVQGGQIINMSSRAGSLEHTDYTLDYPGYRISKVALNMTTRIWGERLRGKIKVSSVHPGWIQTDMGGEEAPTAPEEAAEDIYALAHSDIETGQFWFKGERFPW